MVCVITHRVKMCDPEGVCGGVRPICCLTAVGLSYVIASCSSQAAPMLSLMPAALCQTYVTLTRY